MGSSKSQSTTTMKNIPVYAEVYVKDYLLRANSIAFDAANDQYFTAYTGETYAPMLTNELDGINKLATRGRSGSLEVTKANSVITNVMDGIYLSGATVDFQAMLTNATTKPSNTFETQIRNLLGGSLYLVGDSSNENQSFALTTPIAARYKDRALALMYETNYRNERDNQNRLLPKAIEYAQESIKDAEWLRKAGLYYRIWLQGSYEDSYKKFYEGEILSVNRVEVLGNSIRALVGTQRKTTAPFYRPSPIVSMVGGAMSGAAMGAMLAAPTGGLSVLAGALIGGGAGGILGLFS
ncbi:MAG: hypothetical protein NUV76_12170 [Candidatus Kuenenia sp.]|nr:hypothetical protein [Candidatus Kuenenia sp.]